MTTQLKLTTGRSPDGAAQLTAAGEIDMGNAGEFAAALAEALDGAGPGSLVLDLTAVEYIDSAGLSCVFPHVDRLRLVAGPLLAPVLTISGLGDITTIDGV